MARVRLDAVAAGAVDLSRGAADDVADPGTVGDHLGVAAEGDRLVTHLFECSAAGYPGWRWAVTLARAPRARAATVCEVDLVAGPDSVVAPQWLPWSGRLRPGDVGPGDVLPKVDDDVRLEQGYEATGDGDDIDRLAAWELGLGRPRVLSREGRLEAGERWEAGEYGPEAPMAKMAAQQCRVCGFLLPMAGALRQGFGICTNEWAPADGRVVSLDYGCGAHSETDEVRPDERRPEPFVDDQSVDLVALPAQQSDEEPGSDQTGQN